jgi:signal transduction histidine kinase
MSVRRFLRRLFGRRGRGPERETPAAAGDPPRQKTPASATDLVDMVMEVSEQGLWDWNLLTGQVWLSPAFSDLLGYGPEETEPAARASFGLIHPDDVPGATERLLSHFGRRSPAYEAIVRLRKKDGDYLPVLSRGRVVEWDDSGRPCRIAGIHSALSRKAAPNNAGPNRELHEIQKAAQLGLMAGSIVDDVYNLLTVIIGYQSLLIEDSQAPADFHDPLGIIGEAGQRAASLIQPLLSFRRGDTQPLTANDLHQVIRQFRPLLQYLIPPRIDWTIHLDPGPANVEANTSLLQQAILGLVVNARECDAPRWPTENRYFKGDVRNRRTGPPLESAPGRPCAAYGVRHWSRDR